MLTYLLEWVFHALFIAIFFANPIASLIYHKLSSKIFCFNIKDTFTGNNQVVVLLLFINKVRIE